MNIVDQNYRGFEIQIDPDVTGFRYTIKKLDRHFKITGEADHLLKEKAVKQARKLIDYLFRYGGEL